MKSKSEWIHWGRKNQLDPETHILIPDENQPESYTGLEKIITENHQTKIPRLPWGSQKALIVTLTTNSYPLLESISEKDCVQKLLSKAGFSVNEINADENDNPNILRAKLASNHWDIIHFIGHLKVDEKHFIGHSGGMKAADFVASCCRAGPPRLVILNACRSGDQSVKTDTSGLSGPIAEQFCHRGVDCVIGTRWDIWDKAATEFSRVFWEQITQGLGPFGIEDEVRLEVEDALLKTRKNLKEKFPSRDSIWLAYTLFTSREDGCIIPSQQLVIPQFVPDITHPAYIDIHNHTRICEHLAPGGSGLYLMAAPACTGKTTISILALQTLGFSEEAMASSYLSLRDDASLETIEQLHSTIVSLDSAPFYPLIIDDSERVAAFFGSGLEEKILEISTYLPVLLITRENIADNGLQTLPFMIIDCGADEVIPLKPHFMSPIGLQEYLSQLGCEVSMEECHNLLIRMDMTLVGMPEFMASVIENKPDFDLLEPKAGYQIFSRINALTKDEIFVLQILGSLYEPVVCKLRIILAWELMKQNELVRTDVDVITTLCRLDLLSEYMSTNDLPSDTDIEADFLNKIPEFLTNRTLDEEKLNKLEEMFPNKNLNEDMSWKLPLFSGYQVRNEVLDIVRSLGPHPQEILGIRALTHAFEAYKCHPEMPRMHDGFDDKEVMLKAMQSHPEDKDEIPMDSENLLVSLKLGANSKGDMLDEILLKWLKQSINLSSAILQNPELILMEIMRRLPSLRPDTIAKLGDFVLTNRNIFSLDTPNSALFLCNLILNGKSNPNPFFRSNIREWDSIFKDAEASLLKNQPEKANYIKGMKLKEEMSSLLYFQTHQQREKQLIEAVKAVLVHDSKESIEQCLLLVEACQVMYRHLLFKGSRNALLVFELAVTELGHLVKTEISKETSPWADRIPSFSRYWLWFRIAFCLFNHRLEMRKQKNPKEELRWIRALLLAAKQIRQVGPDLCKTLMSEAASRMLSLKRRTSLTWSNALSEVRARLLRQIADRAWSDFIGIEKWIVNELTFHILYGFDFHNPLPHALRGQNLPEPRPTKDKEQEHKRIIRSIIKKGTDIYRVPDPLVDISHELRVKSASMSELDKILGPPNALQISEVAALLWNSVLDMGELAQPIGSFAGRYPEFLSQDQRKTAEAFLMKTQEDIYSQDRSNQL